MSEAERLAALADFKAAYEKETKLKQELAKQKEERRDAKRKIDEAKARDEDGGSKRQYHLSKKYLKVQDFIISLI